MKQFCFLFFLFAFSLHAQFQVNGIVKDYSSNKPLPFATITVNNSESFISDVDGKFNILLPKKIISLDVSYIGFYNSTVTITNNKNYYSIFLSPQTNNLKEIVVTNKNQTLAIIKKAIENKNNNDPQKKLSSFEFKSYNKLIVTANPDSIRGQLDSVFIKKSIGIKFTKIDSANYKFKEIISKQHLFQTEKVSLYQFSNARLKETILGAKMAGFKKPIYEITGFNLQSFSIYNNHYKLFETSYNNPISLDGLIDYNYKLLDTTTINGRNTYVIYFKNKQKRKDSSLEGVLYIDQINFAVAKAIMQTKGILNISGTHEFSYIPEEKLWFPTNKTFKITKGKNSDNIKILNETIPFDNDLEDKTTRKKEVSDYIYLLSQSTNFDIKYNIPLQIKKPSIYIEIKDDAIDKPESFWNNYRKDSLDIRSQKTYVLLDSIAIKKRLERRLRMGRKIINGFLPITIFDLDLRKIISYNNYEGFRLGIGGITNEHFSKKYRIEGYSAYGTKDGIFKYKLGIATRIGKFSNTWIGGSYTDDVREIASTSFAVDKSIFKIYDPRPINISTFYNYVSWKGFLETKIIPKTESVWLFSQTIVEPKFNYIYNLNGKLYKNYTMTTAMVSLQWNPFSDYMQTPIGRIEIEKRFPKFTFQYTQSLSKICNNDFDFSKIDFKTEYEIKSLNGQKTNFLFQAGYALGNVPLTHLYNTSPNNITKENIIQRITFAGRNSFETMFFNEFFSNKFASLQFKHSFDRVVLFKKIKPSFVFVSRMVWGNLEKPEQHIGLNYKTLDKGFFESGIEFNQIYKGIGLTAFYRYGPNQLSKFEDNIAIKLSYVLNLGL